MNGTLCRQLPVLVEEDILPSVVVKTDQKPRIPKSTSSEEPPV